MLTISQQAGEKIKIKCFLKATNFLIEELWEIKKLT